MENKKLILSVVLVVSLILSAFNISAVSTEAVTSEEDGALRLFGEGRSAAEQFLATNGKTLGVEPGVLNFETEKQVSDVKMLRYTQEYKGIPIEGSRVDMVFSGGKLSEVRKDYYEGIDISTSAKISSGRAENLARVALGVPGSLKPSSSGIVVLPKNSRYYLAHKIEFPLIQKPLGKWVVYVDAANGKVLEKRNKLIFEDFSDAQALDLSAEEPPQPVPGGGGGGGGGSGGGVSVSGTVTGLIFPEHTEQEQTTTPISNNRVVAGEKHPNNKLFSGVGNNLENYATLTSPITVNGENARLCFDIWASIEETYDIGFVKIYNDADSQIYTFAGNSPGTVDMCDFFSMDISKFAGSSVFVKFGYITDYLFPQSGYYVDNLRIVVTDLNKEEVSTPVDDFEGEQSSWDLDGFSIISDPDFDWQQDSVTNSQGMFDFEAENESNALYSELFGPYAKIINAQGKPSVHYADFNEADLSWDWSADDKSDKQEQTNAFYHTNKIHDYFVADEDFEFMNYEMPVEVNIPYACNAYYDGYGINFFAEGSVQYLDDEGNLIVINCENTALLSDVIYHEYTHAVIDRLYQGYYDQEFGAMHEGFADYFAGTVNNNPCMGEGFFKDEESGPYCLRELNNSLRWPDDSTGEVHDDGRIIGAAAWDLRTELGQASSDSLILNTLKLNSIRFDDFVGDMLLVDDNNGNLADGTPHKADVCDAFYTKHGIGASYCDPNVNHPPILGHIDDIYATVMDKVTITPEAQDLDGDALTFTFEPPFNASGEWQTVCGDAWSYVTTKVAVSDSNGLTDSQYVNVFVYPMPNDSDGDCVPDSSDQVLYNPEDLNTNVNGVSLSVGGSSDLNQEFKGVQNIQLSDASAKPIVEFAWNFSEGALDLLGVGLFKQIDLSTGGTLTNGLHGVISKTLYVDKLRYGSELCIVDDEIKQLDEVSSTCTKPGEIKLACPGTVGGYACELASNKYKVSGLKHSAITEVGDKVCTNCGGGGGGGGGGGNKLPPKAEVTPAPVAPAVKPAIKAQETPEEPASNANPITGAAGFDITKVDWKLATGIGIVALLAILVGAFRASKGFRNSIRKLLRAIVGKKQ